jgi:transcriptional regulator with XRE-family HTH domain
MPRDKTLVAFGREVRRRRHAQGMTLYALAAASDLGANYIGGIEGARRNPSLVTLRKLATGLGTPLGELIGLPEMTGDAIEGARLLTALPDEVRSPILGTLRALATVFRGRT